MKNNFFKFLAFLWDFIRMFDPKTEYNSPYEKAVHEIDGYKLGQIIRKGSEKS